MKQNPNDHFAPGVDTKHFRVIEGGRATPAAPSPSTDRRALSFETTLSDEELRRYGYRAYGSGPGYRGYTLPDLPEGA
jgi:hypothetical protein